MTTVTKKKLIQLISQERGVHPNDVRNVIQSFLDALKKDYILISKLHNFQVIFQNIQATIMVKLVYRELL